MTTECSVKIPYMVFLVGLLAACNPTPKPPERPSGVPPAAVWAGGVDGGHWVDCKVEADKPGNPCTVYHDTTAEVVASGLFVLRSSHKAASPDQLQYDFFDGRSIYLASGDVLDPVAQEHAEPAR